jgi:phenylacetate-CoA ligase
VRTLGEVLGADARALCREAWDVRIADVYSAEEVGYIGLQCPQHEHYHLQSESLLVEVLDEHGRPCRPGEVGRVVVTTLQNFAMPLVRYAIGDYASVGEACACGRGLPVLQSIAGRVNSMLVTADGGRYWPVFGMRPAQSFVTIRQHQFVQKRFDLVEARLVVDAPLSAEQEGRLLQHMVHGLPAGIHMKIVYCDAIARGPGGKFQDFICEVGAA